MAGRYLRSCPVCGGEIRRASAPYVVGQVVVEPELEVDKCSKCGEEFYAAKQVVRAQEKATRLGLWKPRLEEERELKKIGGSLVVSIPRVMAKELGLAPKGKVKMRLTWQGISITKSKR
ncbi:MAG: YgiT-type zinc finger protein [Candidatus Hadarchaeota archaeon]